MTTWRPASQTAGQKSPEMSSRSAFCIYTLHLLFYNCGLSFREFMPSLDEFFAEAIEQADPANMVEEEYK